MARGFKKIICIGRKRKVLPEDNPTSVVVISPTATSVDNEVNDFTQTYDQSSYSNYHSTYYPSNQSQSWDNTGFYDEPSLPPTTVYSSTAVANNDEDLEPEIDFFKDMEPTVKVKKVVVRKKSGPSTPTNRLAMDRDLEFKVSEDLDEWVEDGGWDDGDEEDFDIDETQILREAREQRRLERQHKKQQRHEKIKTQDKLGLKVS